MPHKILSPPPMVARSRSLIALTFHLPDHTRHGYLTDPISVSFRAFLFRIYVGHAKLGSLEVELLTSC